MISDFPQMENGVGMVRSFLTQFNAALTRRGVTLSPSLKRGRGTICTGKVFYPYLKRCVDRLGMDLKTVAVESRFWGPGIGVAGLLTGSDFITALKGKVYGDFVVLPSESMIGDDYLFLDEATASLDEAAEAALYHLLETELPATTIVSIGHRSTLMAFHDRHLRLQPEGEYHRIREAALGQMAS